MTSFYVEFDPNDIALELLSNEQVVKILNWFTKKGALKATTSTAILSHERRHVSVSPLGTKCCRQECDDFRTLFKKFKNKPRRLRRLLRDFIKALNDIQLEVPSVWNRYWLLYRRSADLDLEECNRNVHKTFTELGMESGNSNLKNTYYLFYR